MIVSQKHNFVIYLLIPILFINIFLYSSSAKLRKFSTTNVHTTDVYSRIKPTDSYNEEASLPESRFYQRNENS